jgi:hypothetical protein
LANAFVHPFEYAGELTMVGLPFGGAHVGDDMIVVFVMLTVRTGSIPCDTGLFFDTTILLCL